MKKLLLLASLFIAAAAAPAGQTLSAERLARIDKLFQQYVDESRLGCAVALLLQDGKPVYRRALGWSDHVANRRLATDTHFRIEYQTTPLTPGRILSLI